MIRKLTALTLGVSTFLAASAASTAFAQSAYEEKAQAFEDESGWSLAGLLGFGFGGYNAFSIGVRGGYTLPNHVYLGGTFIESPGVATYYGNSFMTGFEGGYDIKAGPLVVRPYGGLGLLDISYSYNYAGLCDSALGLNNCGSFSQNDAYFAFWFGGTVLYPITEHWFVGGDLRFLIAGVNSAYGGTSVFTAGIMGTGGYQF